MRRTASLALLVATTLLGLLAAPSHSRSFVINTHTNEADGTPGDGFCDVSGDPGEQCTFLAALQETRLNLVEVDTLRIPRAGDSVRYVAFNVMVDINKPFVVIDSSYLATGNVRYRFEGLSLRLLASPVHIEGLSFTRAGTNRSSLALLGPGPDRVKSNFFNLTPGDSGTGGTTAMKAMLLGHHNVGTTIESNYFGIFGTAFSGDNVILTYGDSTKFLRNSFGLTKAGQSVLFNGSGITASGYTSTGIGGASDTLFAPVGGRIEDNRMALCSEKSQGVVLGGSAGESGTIGWKVLRNRMGVDTLGNAISGCSASIDESYSGVALSSSTAQQIVTGNLVADNVIGFVPNGIVLRGPGTYGDTVRSNGVGTKAAGGRFPIAFNGIFMHGGANANLIEQNLVGGAATGIRFAWGTGYGDALNNIVRQNLVGLTTLGEAEVHNDTGIVLDYTSAGNLIEGNTIAGNTQDGLVLASFFLLPNRIENNRFGTSPTGLLRPNGGSSFRSTTGAARQVVTGNTFGPAGHWSFEVSNASRASTIANNHFLGGQDSGGILFTGSDSLRLLDNRFDSCKVACVVLRGSKTSLVARNRFGGTSPAFIGAPHPTQSFRVTAAILDSNTLPAILVPVDLQGNVGYTPNDALDADEGPMGLLNHPLIQTAGIQGDSLALTYNLDLAVATGSPRITLYAKLPDSTVLKPLGSWPVEVGTSRTLKVRTLVNLPAGTRLRAGLTDAAGNSSEIDTGRVISGVAASTLTLTAPTVLTKWRGTSNQNITWTSSGVGARVKLEYSLDNGATWALLADSILTATGAKGWTVPDTVTTVAKIRISEVGNPTLNSVSSAFAITRLRLIAPNGGERWAWNIPSQTHVITWAAASDITTVNLQYSLNNGSTWANITPNIGTSAGAGTYNTWNLTSAMISSQVRVRIQDNAYPDDVFDVSDATFTIYDQEVGVLNPHATLRFDMSTANPAFIRFTLPASEANVRLDVINARGKIVATLVNGPAEAGLHTVSLDAARLPSGIYTYRLKAGNKEIVRRAPAIK